jgi:phosphoglycerate kinase
MPRHPVIYFIVHRPSAIDLTSGRLGYPQKGCKTGKQLTGRAGVKKISGFPWVWGRISLVRTLNEYGLGSKEGGFMPGISNSCQKKTIDDIEVEGKRVFLRADLNVPLDENRNITSDLRIRASLPTIRNLINRGASVVLASHLGRPGGQVKADLSLAPVAERLGELLGREVLLAPDCIGEETEYLAGSLKPGQLLVLENVRFHAEEEKNDLDFSRKLAGLADIYVNDAFGTAHRAHATTEGITRFLRPAVSGFLIARELEYLGRALSEPVRPMVAILGGAKVDSKIGVITNLMKLADTLVIGGGMAYTFLKAKGCRIGNSLFDAESFERAREILAEAESSGIELSLPVDCLVADSLSAEARVRIVDSEEIPENWIGVDIGPRTVEMIGGKIRDAGLVIWNGPMGIFEIDQFAGGTRRVAEIMAENAGISIIGGGDSAAAVDKFDLGEKMNHISTGGGASLEFMEGRILPGVAALDTKP